MSPPGVCRRFRSKYHPEECVQRRDEARAALKRRNHVFSKLIELGYLKDVSVDLDHSDVLVKLLDAGEWSTGQNSVTRIFVDLV